MAFRGSSSQRGSGSDLPFYAGDKGSKRQGGMPLLSILLGIALVGSLFGVQSQHSQKMLLERQNSELKASLDHVTGQFTGSTMTINTLQAQNSDLVRKVTGVEEQLRQAQRRTQVAEASASSSQMEFDSLKQQAAEAVKASDEAKAEAGRLRDSITTTMAQQAASQSQQHRLVVERMQSQLSDLTAELAKERAEAAAAAAGRLAAESAHAAARASAGADAQAAAVAAEAAAHQAAAHQATAASAAGGTHDQHAAAGHALEAKPHEPEHVAAVHVVPHEPEHVAAVAHDSHWVDVAHEESLRAIGAASAHTDAGGARYDASETATQRLAARVRELEAGVAGNAPPMSLDEAARARSYRLGHGGEEHLRTQFNARRADDEVAEAARTAANSRGHAGGEGSWGGMEHHRYDEPRR